MRHWWLTILSVMVMTVGAIYNSSSNGKVFGADKNAVKPVLIAQDFNATPDTSTPNTSVQVEKAPPKKKGFDADVKINSGTAQQFKNQGYDFAIRYISLGTEETTVDLDKQVNRLIISSSINCQVQR